MAHINLLPWRDWDRERRKKEFFANLAGAFIAAVMLVGAGYYYLDGEVDRQSARNDWLRDRIVDLDKSIAEIRNLRQEREQLLARMRVIQELQGNRPVIVRVFDEMVRSNATGTFFTSLRLDGQTVSMAGTAESNNRISTLMRNLESSEWFAEPNLKGIRENAAFGPQASTFQMTVQQINPDKSTSGTGG